MDKKKSIINIQDLGLSATNQHSVGGQPILQVIFRKLSIFRKFVSIFRNEISIFKQFLISRKFFQDIGGQPIP
jgi:hypothetical protein